MMLIVFDIFYDHEVIITAYFKRKKEQYSRDLMIFYVE